MPKIKSLTVEIICSDSNTPPSNGQVKLSLLDVSLADAPATVVSELCLRWGTGFPITLPLPFDWSQIDQKHDYAIAARIEHDGELMYINTSRYPVKAGITTYQVAVDKVRPSTDGIHGGNLID
ncbi:YbaY family lipoprotein [Pseudomonas sp. NBRC 111124]|uniref:YbaY family lipoprotein n=1 Tax=Pseudomonas sp. NBRC 111124 TaxID=1661039 RepID=UPI0009E7CF72|nr:YbaY family lipoprotein [Pseudomonas sp. NBRC 111124]